MPVQYNIKRLNGFSGNSKVSGVLNYSIGDGKNKIVSASASASAQGSTASEAYSQAEQKAISIVRSRLQNKLGSITLKDTTTPTTTSNITYTTSTTSSGIAPQVFTANGYTGVCFVSNNEITITPGSSPLNLGFLVIGSGGTNTAASAVAGLGCGGGGFYFSNPTMTQTPYNITESTSFSINFQDNESQLFNTTNNDKCFATNAIQNASGSSNFSGYFLTAEVNFGAGGNGGFPSSVGENSDLIQVALPFLSTEGLNFNISGGGGGCCNAKSTGGAAYGTGGKSCGSGNPVPNSKYGIVSGSYGGYGAGCGCNVANATLPTTAPGCVIIWWAN